MEAVFCRSCRTFQMAAMRDGTTMCSSCESDDVEAKPSELFLLDVLRGINFSLDDIRRRYLGEDD